MSKEGILRSRVNNLSCSHDYIACQMGISNKELDRWLNGRSNKSMINKNLKIMLYEIDEGKMPFTEQEITTFWSFIQMLHDRVTIKKQNLLSEIVFLETAMEQTSEELRKWQIIYHYYTRQLAWKLLKCYRKLNISIANRIILNGKQYYESYINNLKSSNKTLLKKYQQEEPFRYLERIFLQYKYDKIPIYLWGTKAFPELRIGEVPLLTAPSRI